VGPQAATGLFEKHGLLEIAPLEGHTGTDAAIFDRCRPFAAQSGPGGNKGVCPEYLASAVYDDAVSGYPIGINFLANFNTLWSKNLNALLNQSFDGLHADAPGSG
jgi:hypothetical protein